MAEQLRANGRRFLVVVCVRWRSPLASLGLWLPFLQHREQLLPELSQLLLDTAYFLSDYRDIQQHQGTAVGTDHGRMSPHKADGPRDPPVTLGAGDVDLVV